MKPLSAKSSDFRTIKTGAKGTRAPFERWDAVLRRNAKNSPASNGSTEGSCEGSDAEVETIVEEGVVKKIIVRCSCGKTTEIDCVYES